MSKFKIPSELVKSQISLSVRSAIETFRDIRHKVGLLGEIYRLLVRCFTNLGKPMMQVREALPDGPPWLDDYNSTIREIHDDLVVLTGEANLQKQAVVLDYNFAKTENRLLQSKLSAIEDKFRDVRLYHGSRLLSLFARDSFNDTSKIDRDKITGEPADVNTQAGFVSLKRTGSEERQSNAKVEIIPGTPIEGTYGLLGSDSNGFPGNLHELTIDPASQYRPLESDDQRFKFVGEDNPHADWGAVIDGNPDTWFEYELVNLEQKYKDIAKGYGFAFDVPGGGQIRWDRDPEGGKLKLHLQVTLPEPVLVNWISVRLHTPPNDGAVPAKIEDIRVSRDGAAFPESIIDVSQQSVSELGDRIFSFSPRTVKVAHFYFSQDAKFDIAVGHIYYKRVTVKRRHKEYLFGIIKGSSSTETSIQRIDGPNMPITALGVEVKNPGESVGTAIAGVGMLAYTAAQAGIALGIAGAAALGPIGMALAVAGAVIAGLVSEKVEILRDDVESGIEMFPGWRYAIGVADVSLNTYTFAEQGEIVSIPYISPSPISSVSLRTVDFVPESFGEGRWIRYYISIDDGGTWHEIAPMGKDYTDVPEIYRINSRELPETRSSRVGYLESDGDVYAVRLKAVMERPVSDEMKYYTPVIYDYVLTITIEQ